MFNPGYYQALPAVGRLPPQAIPGLRRWSQATAPAPLPMSTTTSRRSLVSHAAINIPPDALVHPFRKTFGSDSRWGIEKVEKNVGNKGEEEEIIKLWFLLTGFDEAKVKDEVEVNLPRGSNVLTIKQIKKAANEDDQLDVRLLLTAGCSRDGIKVEKGNKDDGKVSLEVTIIRKITEIVEINIK